MPLLDHFREPVVRRYPWESFHTLWASVLTGQLNQVLPNEYFAAAQVHVGGAIEVDVATLMPEDPVAEAQAGNGPTGLSQRVDGHSATATLEAWAPPQVDLVLPGHFPPEFEVQVFRTTAGPELVGALELVSPGNKDRPEARRAFASKCATYLHAGVGLLFVDIVSTRQANLHDEMVALLQRGDAFRFPLPSPLYAVSYHPVRRKEADQLDTWFRPLAVDQPLPIMPLALKGGPIIPVDLETAYTDARQMSRL